jgi:curved DNA-binding protein CbpA
VTEADLYAVLELEPNASAAAIRAAFRRLARANHPDLGGGSAERMIAINRAYAILSDPEQRRRYDARRATRSEVAQPPPEPEREVALEDPPWRLDLERGQDMDDWQQMYAEERHVWEQLLRSRPDPDPAIEQALERARRDQLELENAIRARQGLPPLDVADLESRRWESHHGRRAEAARAGCAAILLALFTSRLAR